MACPQPPSGGSACDTGGSRTHPTAPARPGGNSPPRHTRATAGCPPGATSGETRNSARRAPLERRPPRVRPLHLDHCQLGHRAHSRSSTMPSTPVSRSWVAQILDVQMRVDLLCGVHRAVRDQLTDYLQRHPGAPAERRVGVPEPVRREVKSHPPGACRAPDRSRSRRSPDGRPARPTDSRTRNQSSGRRTRRACTRRTGASAPPRPARSRARPFPAPRWRCPRGSTDLNPVLPGDDVLVAQPERLPDPHPGLKQQREQEPIP